MEYTEVLEQRDLGDGTIEALVADQAGNRAWKRVKRGADGKVMQVGPLRPVRGFGGEAAAEASKGLTGAAAYTGGFNLAATIQGMGTDLVSTLMERGDRANMEEGVYTDTPLKALTAIGKGAAAYGSDFWGWVNDDEPPNPGGSTDPLAGLSPAQLRALAAALPPNPTMADIKRGIAAVHESGVGIRPDAELSANLGAKGALVNLMDSDEADIAANPLLHRILSAAGRAQEAEQFVEGYIPAGDRAHFNKHQLRGLGAARTLAEVIVPSYKGVGMLANAAGKNAGKATKTGGAVATNVATPIAGVSGPDLVDALSSAQSGEPKPTLTAEEEYERGRMYSLVGSIASPLSLSAAGALGKRGVDAVKNRGLNSTTGERREVLTNLVKGAYSDKKMSDAMAVLREHGVRLPAGVTNFEMMGEAAVPWIRQLLNKHPDMKEELLAVLGERTAQVRGMLQGGTSSAALRHGDEGMDYADASALGLKQQAQGVLDRQRAGLDARYKTIGEAMRGQLLPGGKSKAERKARVKDLDEILDETRQGAYTPPEIEKWMRKLKGIYNKRDASYHDLLVARRELRDLTNSPAFRANPNNKKGAFNKMQQWMTDRLKEAPSGEKLSEVDDLYRQYATSRRQFGKMTNVDDTTAEGLGKKLVRANGEIEATNYTNLRNAIGTNKEAVAELDRVVAARVAGALRKGNGSGKERGNRLMGVISNNDAMLSKEENAGLFAQVARAVKNDMSDILRKTGDNPSLGGTGRQFLEDISTPEKAQMVLRAMRKAYGDEEGRQVMQWAMTNNIVHARRPAEQFAKTRKALRATGLTDEQVNVMGALSTVYENAGHFDMDKLLQTNFSPAEMGGMVGKTAEILQSQFGVSFPMLASNLKAWAIRTQGPTTIATAAATRFWNAQSTKDAFRVLLAEAGKDAGVAAAVASGNWKNISRTQAKALWQRVFPPAAMSTLQQTEGEQRREQVEAQRAGTGRQQVYDGYGALRRAYQQDRQGGN